MLDVAIIGGGLSGLSLAQRLFEANRTFSVFESRVRFGGRVYSVPVSSLKYRQNTNFRGDLGPSWVWPDDQPRIANFIEKNKIEKYSQWSSGKTLYQTAREHSPLAYADHNTYGSAYRISGGAYQLIHVLLKQLPPDSLKLNHHLLQVNNKEEYVELHFDTNHSRVTVNAKQVVITIPPRLVASTILFNPVLDLRLRDLMNNTITWMASHAKTMVYYPRAFWREANYSGSVLAGYPGAALSEIFDACSPNGEQAALWGFFALPAGLRTKYRSDLEALIVEQLVRLFGKEAAQPEEIIIKDWFNEPLTATLADEYPPAAHPQYGHVWLQLDHWNEKLYFGGTETASQFGGYLEGALESTERVANCLSI